MIALFGVLSFLAFVITVLTAIILKIKKKPAKFWGLGALISFILFVICIAFSPDDIEYTEEENSTASKQEQKQSKDNKKDDKDKKQDEHKNDDKSKHEKQDKKNDDKDKKLKDHKEKSSKDENNNVKTNDKTKEDKSYKKDTDNNVVKFVRVVDGDTVVLKENGKEDTYRLLLIDTPETEHPQKDIEPYGPEASERTLDLVSSASKLTIEYDKGDKLDKHGRKLVYLYADGKMVNDVLVREGLARVKYIYPPNVTHLDQLKASQSKAKQEKLNIWSDEEHITEEDTTEEEPLTEEIPEEYNTPDTDVDVPEKNDIPTPPSTGVDKPKPGEITRGMPGYDASKDRDKDGIINEQ